MQSDSPYLFIEINNSEFIFIVIENVENNEFKLLYEISVPIEGIQNNKISDHNLVFEIFKKNIYLIEQKLKLFFKETIVVINNFNCSIVNLSGYKKLNGSQLVKENITYILNSLKSKIDEIESKKKILQIFNSKYILDKSEIKNLPIGLFGDFYSHELSFFLIDNNDFNNLKNIFDKCNLKVKKFISKDFLQGSNLINHQSNVETFFKIEILKKKSKIIFFENSSLKYSQNFKFGSDIILIDISKITGLKIEDIKEILTRTNFNSENEEKEFVEERHFLNQNFRKIKKKLLLDILKARIQEFSEIILLKNINVHSFLDKRIPIFLVLQDDLNAQCLIENYKFYFSKENNFNVDLIENYSLESLYSHARKIGQYGWKKEAVPVVQEKKSLITRFFNLFFGD